MPMLMRTNTSTHGAHAAVAARTGTKEHQAKRLRGCGCVRARHQQRIRYARRHERSRAAPPASPAAARAASYDAPEYDEELDEEDGALAPGALAPGALASPSAA